MDSGSFRTFRAMIAYLHTGIVPFLAIGSDFLSQAGTDAEPTDWLHADFDEVRGGLDWNGVKPCTAHSMYRLATRYSMKEL